MFQTANQSSITRAAAQTAARRKNRFLPVLLLVGLCWNPDTVLAQELPVDMAPSIAEPAGKSVPREPRCELGHNTITFSNGNLRCMFATADGRLTLRSLYNEYTRGEMLLEPGLPALFVVEANGKRFIGSRDFDLRGLGPDSCQEGLRQPLPRWSQDLLPPLQLHGQGLQRTGAQNRPAGRTPPVRHAPLPGTCGGREHPRRGAYPQER